jgi:hypothetical protein
MSISSIIFLCIPLNQFGVSNVPVRVDTDLRPSITQLRVAEMVRRILQRAILTGAFMELSEIEVIFSLYL